MRRPVTSALFIAYFSAILLFLSVSFFKRHAASFMASQDSAVLGTMSFTIYPGHTSSCSASSQDIIFTGTENIEFTTCISNIDNASAFYLFANKPKSLKDNPNDSIYKIYEQPIDPWSSENNIPDSLHAKIDINQKKYIGAISATSGDSRTITWGVGNFVAGSGKHIYLNKTLPDTLYYQSSSPTSQARWSVAAVNKVGNNLVINWNFQILDMQLLEDDQFAGEYGVDKSLEVYFKVDGNAWTNSGKLLRRDGNLPHTGITDGKDHTVYKDGDTYRLISMKGNSAPKTYTDANFKISQLSSGYINVHSLNYNEPVLSSDFNITNSSLFCRLSSPYLYKDPITNLYNFYFTVFRKEGTNNCQTLGMQEIYKTTASSLNASLSLGSRQFYRNTARDPFVYKYDNAANKSIYYTHMNEYKIMNDKNGEVTTVFTDPNHWPETPYIVKAPGQAEVLFYSGFGPTRYLKKVGSSWQFKDYLSIPRVYDHYINSEGKRKFLSDHGAAEFWTLDDNASAIISSFIGVHCNNVASWDCQNSPIKLGFINFDSRNQPYLATRSVPKPTITAPPVLVCSEGQVCHCGSDSMQCAPGYVYACTGTSCAKECGVGNGQCCGCVPQ